jgi:hypothetical protein
MATVMQQRVGLDEATVEKASRAIWYWATIGVFFVGLQCWIFLQWYLNGDMRPVDPGPSQMSDGLRTFARINELFWIVTIIAVGWICVLKPYFRNGRLSFDGLLCLAFIFVWWQDSMFNYTTIGFGYNAASTNLGSWSCHIPGWLAPNGCKLAVPLAWDFSFYFVLSAVGVIVASNIMRWFQSRNPSLRTDTLFIGLFIGVAIFDFLFEFGFVWAGLYHYGGAIDELSWFTEETYKFPKYEPILIGFLFSLWVSVRYFKNDKGETLAERGLDQVRTSATGKTALRFFALAGILNITFLVGYNVPVQFFQLHADEWPQAIQERSYLTTGICGAGTNYTCGGTGTPIPRAGTAISIDPNGKTIVPEGTEMPTAVPFRIEP